MDKASQDAEGSREDSRQKKENQIAIKEKAKKLKDKPIFWDW